MRIAILTMVFNNNYGGVLQAYALQTHLKKLGHETTLLYVQKKKLSAYSLLMRTFKRILFKYVLQHKDIISISYLKEEKFIGQNFEYFINKCITPKTKPLYSGKDLSDIAQKGFDAYIVGSDQVWRPKMYSYIDQAFFDFVKQPDAIKLSYAPSFGVDEWEYTEEQTQRYKEQIKKFKAISVRESSGVELCRNFFDIDALQVLDPTLLLNTSDYKKMVEDESIKKSDGNLLIYTLDNNIEKQKIVEKISGLFGYKPFYTNVKPKELAEKHEDRIYPSVFGWLKGFMDAEYVFTDSFHGCVFAILFNKPFLVFGNKRRGMARFNSLLGIFNLEDRLIHSSEEATVEKLSATFDWESINKVLEQRRGIANKFLTDNLHKA